MKVKVVLSTTLLFVLLLAGCTPQQGPVTQQPKPTQTSEPDSVSTASIVGDEASFEKAISDSGTWLIALTKDLTFDKELVLDGVYTNGKKDENGQEIIQRKIGLYEQDENRNITARYTLTIPKLTINSPNASIQHGTFKGDLYVSAKNFQLIDTKVEGNVYFTNEEAQSTFKADEKSSITGKQELVK
ncbi:hypothetical protein [Acetivibrio straminisolvens]|uniref:Lipoprotein n=1 Tax=Acetivibrio straminisolvens JCM 21531 TaxID=1294263 RepID=W4V1J7_9FIRM|nr:hypothetical protein [Acetivibrio straminisolvens]GAE86962.1 hypothetical protein JCM21531_298 [Acetivibrio straminisolvens JCM 21531]